MALINENSVNKYAPLQSRFLVDNQILVFGDWKDETVFIESYPNYCYYKDTDSIKGSYKSKWIIVPKNDVDQLVNSLNQYFTDGCMINIIDFKANKTDTIDNFLNSNSNIELSESKIIYVDTDHVMNTLILEQ